MPQSKMARIQTKSNYENLNGQWLEVVSTTDQYVACRRYSEELNKFVVTDFTHAEIAEIRLVDNQ